jgi:hypothetical protein
MIGAIAGDIIGSVYEHHLIKTKKVWGIVWREIVSTAKDFFVKTPG